MVVIVEELPQEPPAGARDMTNAANEEDEAAQPVDTGSLAQEARAEESEEWVKVNPEDAASPRRGPTTPSEDDPEEEPEESELVDPEVFAEQLARAEASKLEGNRLFADGDMEEAMERYTDAIDAAPPSAPLQRSIYYANRAACHVQLQNHAEAAMDCSAALDLRPTYMKALLRRAAAFEALGELEKALADLEKAKEVEPENAAVVAALARVEPLVAAKREEMKEEMIGKLKDLGNTLLGKFGMSLDSFNMEKDPATGSYSIKFQQ